MSMLTKSAVHLTDAGKHCWKSWKGILENEQYGTPIKDFETQRWASIVLENTMVGGPSGQEGGNIEHRSKINKPMLESYLERDDNGVIIGQKAENVREKLFEDAVAFAPDADDIALLEADTYSAAYSNAAGSAYTGTDQVGGVAKRLPLLFRRGITSLIAPAFMAVQPMSASHGYVYTVKGRYRGNGQNKIKLGLGFVYVLASDVDALPNWAPDKTTLIENFNPILTGHVTQLNSNATGIVRFREGTKILVEKTDDANVFTSNAVDTLSVGDGGGAGNDVTAPSALFDDEAGYKVYFENYSWGNFLPNYTDFSTTAGNTTAQSEAGVEVQEMGLTITQNRAQAETRKIKASWPKEVQEDLGGNTNLSYLAEIMREMYREMNLNMNREAVRLVNANARQINSFDVGTQTDGRWFVERIMSFVSQIDAQAEGILIDTRRGRANRLLVSPLVKVMLSQLNIWRDNNISGTQLDDIQNYAGSLGGKYDVHVDIFAQEDYVNIAYKGASPTDAGYFWCPYIGLQFADATHPENLWDTIAGLRTRYAILKNPLGPQLWYRYMPVTGISDLGFSISS